VQNDGAWAQYNRLSSDPQGAHQLVGKSNIAFTSEFLLCSSTRSYLEQPNSLVHLEDTIYCTSSRCHSCNLCLFLYQTIYRSTTNKIASQCSICQDIVLSRTITSLTPLLNTLVHQWTWRAEGLLVSNTALTAEWSIYTITQWPCR